MPELHVEITQDDNPNSPRDDDNVGKMVCFHKRYRLGDKHDYKVDDYSGWDAMRDDIEKRERPVVILPLYLYDHSGITMNTTGFSCPWDSGQVGWIFATRQSVKGLLGIKRITRKGLVSIQQTLVGEVESYDMYLRGDVYGYTITDDKGEHVDSCWGFYGEEYCRQAAEEARKHFATVPA